MDIKVQHEDKLVVINTVNKISDNDMKLLSDSIKTKYGKDFSIFYECNVPDCGCKGKKK